MSIFSGPNPVSPKIVAAIAGAGFGTALGNVIVWLLGAWLWHGGWGADQVQAAMDAVPAPVAAVVVVVVAAICAAIPGYQVNDPLRQVQIRDPKTGRFV
jgi:hypothetical protein